VPVLSTIANVGIGRRNSWICADVNLNRGFVLVSVSVSAFVTAPSPCWTAFEMEGAMSGEAAVEAIPATIKSLLLKVIALSSVVLVRVRVLVLVLIEDKDENCSCNKCGDSGSLTFMSLKEKALACIVSEITTKIL